MEYVRLGKTDILVSRIAFGAMRLSNALGQDNAASIVRKAYDSGINFFDTTSKIPESEKLLGDALYDIRRNVFLSTTTAALTAKEIKDNIEELYRTLISNTLVRNPDIYNGYKVLNLDIIENIISYIANEVTNLTITSLNKYLWLIDMISFRERAIAITGLTYQKQQFGPTIADQRYKEISLLDDKYLREDYEDELGSKTLIKSNKNFELSGLRKEEIEVVNRVINFLKDKSVSEISELTHKELALKNTKKLENISFEYAEKLKMI